MNNYCLLLEVNKFKQFNSKNNKSLANQVNCVFFSQRNKISNPLKIIKFLPKNSAIIFREYDLPKNLRFTEAQKIIAEIKKFPEKKIKFIIGKDLDLALKLKANGVHLSDNDLKKFSDFNKKNLPKNFITSMAIHNFKNFIYAKKANIDWVFFSPIFSTTTHPNQQNIGLTKLSRFLIKTKYFVDSKNFKPRIFALGGINFSNIKLVRSLKIAGFGAIDLFKLYDNNN